MRTDSADWRDKVQGNASLIQLIAATPWTFVVGFFGLVVLTAVLWAVWAVILWWPT